MNSLDSIDRARARLDRRAKRRDIVHGVFWTVVVLVAYAGIYIGAAYFHGWRP